MIHLNAVLVAFRIRTGGLALAFLSLFLSVSTAFSQTPADVAEAQEILNEVRKNQLTLEFLISRSRKSSEVYDAIEALKFSSEAAALRATAPFRPRLSLDLFTGRNQLEPRSPFEPDLIRSTGARVGLLQTIPTGTEFDLGLGVGATALGFPPNPSASIPNLDLREARADLTIRQSLLRNRFGESSRLSAQSARLLSEAQELQRRAELEAWTQGLVDQYYTAWLSQDRVKTALESRDRRKRLVSITRVRIGRGTAERPDLIEAEGSLLASEIEVRSSREALGRIWHALGTALDAPQVLESIDPMSIPMKLDDTYLQADRACKEQPPQFKSGSGARAKKEAERAILEEKRAESDNKADLQLRASLASNGVSSSSFGDSFSETVGADHPYWELGLRIEWPIGMQESNARLLESRTQSLRASGQATSIEEQEQIEWRALCQELARRMSDIKELRENARLQSERARLEQERFGIGRVRLNDVIRAEDEAALSQVRLREEEVAIRRAAWRIQEMTGSIPEFLGRLP